ncbi:uncharacterized protein BDV14DRAFT_14626 [Aspergillus stella-maris]|uniref:uncharacterized protein n=1 Tax=Aspergillus stella-maris TaxID=1810926 RepID=UPI003CCE2DF8
MTSKYFKHRVLFNTFLLWGYLCALEEIRPHRLTNHRHLILMKIDKLNFASFKTGLSVSSSIQDSCGNTKQIKQSMASASCTVLCIYPHSQRRTLFPVSTNACTWI